MHRNGQNIEDGNAKNVVLRGLGLGGWMVHEGYMIQTGALLGVNKNQAKNNRLNWSGKHGRGLKKENPLNHKI